VAGTLLYQERGSDEKDVEIESEDEPVEVIVD
jgi:hypothetical protein